MAIIDDHDDKHAAIEAGTVLFRVVNPVHAGDLQLLDGGGAIFSEEWAMFTAEPMSYLSAMIR